MQNIVVGPARWRTIVLAVVCLAFTVVGVLLMINGEWFDKVLGALAVVAFGLAGGYYLVRMARRSTTLTLTPGGIVIAAGGHVPWSNVGKVGTTKALGGAPALGIQLRNPKVYVASLTPEQQRESLTATKIALGVSQRWDDDARANPAAALTAATNRLAQKADGYHLVFPMMTLNRSAGQVADDLEAYRAALKTR